jgi:hypothetical protein
LPCTLRSSGRASLSTQRRKNLGCLVLGTIVDSKEHKVWGDLYKTTKPFAQDRRGYWRPYYRLASARQAPRRELWGHIHPALGKQVLSLVRFFPEDRHSELESGLNFAHSVQTG